jgi:hypothetical protein
MLGLVDPRAAALAHVGRAVDAALAAAAVACTSGGVAVHAAAAIGGSAVLTRLGAATSDIDVDAPLRIVLPPGLAAQPARALAGETMARFVAEAAERLDAARGLPVRFGGLQVVEAGGEDAATWEWRAGESLERVREAIALAHAASLLLVAGSETEPVLVDVRLHRAYLSPGGAADFEIRMGPLWFAHVAFSRDAARRFAAHERAVARHFPDRYDEASTWLMQADTIIREQSERGRWLKVAKVIPLRAAWVGEDALVARLPELLGSPLARAVSAANRAGHALQLAARGLIPAAAARAACEARLREAASHRARALPRAPPWPLEDVGAIAAELHDLANEEARRWLAALR